MVAKYYQKNKEMLKRKSRENNCNLFSEEENKKRDFARNRYRNLFIENELSEEGKN